MADNRPDLSAVRKAIQGANLAGFVPVDPGPEGTGAQRSTLAKAGAPKPGRVRGDSP
ncbi:MAG: hypothetical protein IT561_07440 [Alphaproteobacteria bacterium]|nr:hypothetical protein [Alphaproteobacteria bacterium]